MTQEMGQTQQQHQPQLSDDDVTTDPHETSETPWVMDESTPPPLRVSPTPPTPGEVQDMVLGTPMLSQGGTQEMMSQRLEAPPVRPRQQLVTPPPVESMRRQKVLSPSKTPPNVPQTERERPRGMELGGGTVVHYHYHYHYQCCHHDGCGGGGHNHHHPNHNNNHNREYGGDRWERGRPPDGMPDGAWGCERNGESVSGVGTGFGANFGAKSKPRRFWA